MTGVVEYNLDPEHQGRLKVRIFGINDQKRNDEYVIPTEMLPWARPCFNGSGGSASGSGYFSIPKVGSTVMVNGSMNNPIWYCNMYVSDDVISEISGNDYVNSHVLIYDTDFNNGEGGIRDEHIKVFFTERKGFQIEYKNGSGTSNIGITKDGSIKISNSYGDAIVIDKGTINIMSNNTVNVNASMVTLSDKATEAVLKGETVKNLFNSHTHTCNAGETTPPMQKMTDSVLNRHVKV